ENHPLRPIFDEYAKKTPFTDDEIYIEDHRHWKGKLLSFTYGFLPYSMICKMFEAYRYYLVKTNKKEVK
ncbi:MAG: hypothetical protein Q4P18_08500, partial [Methanobrevibacter sp.]|uniref:hypothetical protein n=1 Tax=Methanobrevibacter sp. TaxID=66852 RepID=UPI0026E041AA